MQSQALRTRPLYPGEMVEIRSAEEILATLDENGMLDGMLFMPEMFAWCGKRFSVWKRADKTCDTAGRTGGRRLYNTVHLEGSRCGGESHGGCQARCLIFWKEAWLKCVDEAPSSRDKASAMQLAAASMSRFRCDRQRITDGALRANGSRDCMPLYRCQATELVGATSPLHWWDVRQYWRDVRSGNVSATAMLKAALFRVFRMLLRVGGYRALIWSYDRFQSWQGGTPYPYLHGSREKMPREVLDLQPGELVEVKQYREILETLNARNTNYGLSFDPEMVRYCGKTYHVLARVERIIDERTGKMIKMARDCIMLDNVVCCAEYSGRRLFCPRAIYPYWREIWLKRVESPPRASKAPPEARVLSDESSAMVRHRSPFETDL